KRYQARLQRTWPRPVSIACRYCRPVQRWTRPASHNSFAATNEHASVSAHAGEGTSLYIPPLPVKATLPPYLGDAVDHSARLRALEQELRALEEEREMEVSSLSSLAPGVKHAPADSDEEDEIMPSFQPGNVDGWRSQRASHPVDSTVLDASVETNSFKSAPSLRWSRPQVTSPHETGRSHTPYTPPRPKRPSPHASGPSRILEGGRAEGTPKSVMWKDEVNGTLCDEVNGTLCAALTRARDATADATGREGAKVSGPRQKWTSGQRSEWSQGMTGETAQVLDALWSVGGGGGSGNGRERVQDTRPRGTGQGIASDQGGDSARPGSGNASDEEGEPMHAAVLMLEEEEEEETSLRWQMPPNGSAVHEAFVAAGLRPQMVAARFEAGSVPASSLATAGELGPPHPPLSPPLPGGADAEADIGRASTSQRNMSSGLAAAIATAEGAESPAGSGKSPGDTRPAGKRGLLMRMLGSLVTCTQPRRGTAERRRRANDLYVQERAAAAAKMEAPAAAKECVMEAGGPGEHTGETSTAHVPLVRGPGGIWRPARAVGGGTGRPRTGMRPATDHTRVRAGGAAGSAPARPCPPALAAAAGETPEPRDGAQAVAEAGEGAGLGEDSAEEMEAGLAGLVTMAMQVGEDSYATEQADEILKAVNNKLSNIEIDLDKK
ncbi:MAG: hypothetical protein ACPIOQ_17485, partial [Promethearchaeia archaeon]